MGETNSAQSVMLARSYEAEFKRGYDAGKSSAAKKLRHQKDEIRRLNTALRERRRRDIEKRLIYEFDLLRKATCTLDAVMGNQWRGGMVHGMELARSIVSHAGAAPEIVEQITAHIERHFKAEARG